jgi:hypothetical protein
VVDIGTVASFIAPASQHEVQGTVRRDAMMMSEADYGFDAIVSSWTGSMPESSAALLGGIGPMLRGHP